LQRYLEKQIDVKYYSCCYIGGFRRKGQTDASKEAEKADQLDAAFNASVWLFSPEADNRGATLFVITNTYLVQMMTVTKTASHIF
jgi:hypothetical protein